MNGKQKGGSFERLVAKQLSLWLSNGQRDDLLWRSSLSGGRATLQFKKGKENRSQTGDLSSIDSLSQDFIDKFIIELKSYRSLDILSGFVKGKGTIKRFWDKLVQDAVTAKKNPLLIVKQNHLPPLLFIHKNGSNLLNLNASILLCSRAKIAEFSQWPCEVYLFEELLKQPYKLGVKREKLREESEDGSSLQQR